MFVTFVFSFDLLQGAVFNADNESVKIAIVMKGRETAEAYCKVLSHVSSIIVHPSQPKKQQLVILSKQVATSVSELVKQAELLKGSLFFKEIFTLIIIIIL